jgi:predicted small lipoprotein YifL
MKRLFIYVLILVLSISLFGCTNKVSQTQPSTNAQQDTQQQNTAPEQNNNNKEQASTVKNAVGPIVYENNEYGFSFSLPESWKDYKIVPDKWEGLVFDNDKGEKVAETGPMISIRHPQWTAEKPRQDIPIMVFTINQWNDLQKDKFHIGAAPIGPSELGRNKEYVFALPARYNFAFPTGYEEVEQIVQSGALHPIEK